MDSALRIAVKVRGVEPEQVVLSMVRRIVRADDMDDHGKVYQIQRLIKALEKIHAESSD